MSPIVNIIWSVNEMKAVKIIRLIDITNDHNENDRTIIDTVLHHHFFDVMTPGESLRFLQHIAAATTMTAAGLLLIHNNILETPEPPLLTDTLFLGRDCSALKRPSSSAFCFCLLHALP